MPTVTKPMGIERAYESAKRFAEEAANPHQIYVLAAERDPVTTGYLIPIANGAASPMALQAAAVEPEPREEDIEVIAGAIEETGEPVALGPPTDPKRRKRTPKPVETTYFRNPYKEEPLTPEVCALHLAISTTRFYKLVAENPELKRRACKHRDLKGLRGGMRFTRHVLDRWVKTSAKKGELPLPLFGPRQTGRNLAPCERKVTQARCSVTNKDGSQCRGLTMRGYAVCAIHAMSDTAAKGTANGAREGEETAAA